MGNVLTARAAFFGVGFFGLTEYDVERRAGGRMQFEP